MVKASSTKMRDAIAALEKLGIPYPQIVALAVGGVDGMYEELMRLGLVYRPAEQLWRPRKKRSQVKKSANVKRYFRASVVFFCDVADVDTMIDDWILIASVDNWKYVSSSSSQGESNKTVYRVVVSLKKEIKRA